MTTPEPAALTPGGPAPSRDVRIARIAVSTLFFVKGATLASVVPRLPEIKDSLGLTNAELGTAVAALPVGGLVAGLFIGTLIHRVGSGRLAVIAGLLGAATLAALGFASSWLMLAGIYLVFGALDATMDAAMNAHGIGVQRQYGRSIFHAFHGFWSAGMMAAGALGAVLAGARAPVPVDFAALAVAIAVGTLVAGRGLLPDRVADAAADDGAEPFAIGPRTIPRLLRILGPIALLGILAGTIWDSASTWSPIYLVNTLGLGAGIGAAAFVLATAAMTTGRLTNDRWVNRWGSAVVVRVGALIAAAGLVLVIAAAPLALPILAFVGFFAVGFGSAPMFPAMLAAAGTAPGIPTAHGLAVVFWLSRVGTILAPAFVGVVADSRGLATAFVIPLVAAVLIALLVPRMIGRGVHAIPEAPAPIASDF